MPIVPEVQPGEGDREDLEAWISVTVRYSSATQSYDHLLILFMTARR
jgi:hypothetical protein